MTAHRANNLDALRLVGALSVIVGHAYHALGRAAEVPGMIGYSVSTLGVVIFFSISGYLITASWNRTRDPVSYFAARCLRIFPALAVVALVSVLVIGPLFTTLSMGDYFSNPRTWSYLDNVRMLPQYDLPGVFTDLPYPNVVNGSLWTLAAEFFCYLAVPLLLVGPRVLRAPLVAAALLTAVWLSSTPALESPVIYGSRLSDAAGMWAFFGAGALLRLAHERWSGLFRTDVAVALITGYVCFISVWGSHLGKVAWIALPYAVITIGLATTPYLRRAARFGDLSYGLYIWAFPVQQVVVHLLGVQRMALNLLLVVTITAALAWLSWHVIEKPSMGLKDRLRGRSGARRRIVVPATPAGV